MKITWTAHFQNELSWQDIPAGTVFGVSFAEGGQIEVYLKSQEGVAVSLENGAMITASTPRERLIPLHISELKVHRV